MNPARAWAAALAFVLTLLLGACATPHRPAAPADAMFGPWTGRLALQVADKPQGSFSASFELKGNPEHGELSLFSPLGSTLAVLQWQPGRALLKAGGRDKEYGSVETLIAEVAGAAIPVAALFDWLRGVATPVAGWEPDLSQFTQGRIAARRVEPAPPADLRLVLER